MIIITAQEVTGLNPVEVTKYNKAFKRLKVFFFILCLQQSIQHLYFYLKLY